MCFNYTKSIVEKYYPTCTTAKWKKEQNKKYVIFIWLTHKITHISMTHRKSGQKKNCTTYICAYDYVKSTVKKYYPLCTTAKWKTNQKKCMWLTNKNIYNTIETPPKNLTCLKFR